MSEAKTRTVPLAPLVRHVLLALLLACTSIAASSGIHLVSIDRKLVHMRSGPGTDNKVIWNLARGYPLQVVGRSHGWLKVKDFEDDVGWVLGRLTGRKPHLVVKVPVLNIRRGPGTSNRVVGRAAYGEILRTLDHRGSWVRVRRQPDGPTGWVARKLTWGW